MVKVNLFRDEFIYNESPEVSVGENTFWGRKIFSVFPALQRKNYRLYFSGQAISLIGTWMQIVAQGWLVLQLTNSAFFVGLVAAAASLPALLFSLFGGVIVDRFNKKKILFFTQISSMILAFILGILTVLNLINIYEIMALSFLLGTVNAVDLPARQSLVIELVGKKYLTSAIALNSGIYNAARIVGPAIAGFLIVISGTGGAFIINAISYIAVIIALIFIKPSYNRQEIHPHPLKAIKEGILYAARHNIIRTLLLLTAVTSIFGWSYTTIMPVVAKDVFGQGAQGLGYLYAFSGAGALTASFLVSAFSHKINPMAAIFGGNLLFIISILAFTFTKTLLSSFPFLFLTGLGLVLQFSSINSTIQHLVENKLRGRVMSLYVLMFMGLFPIGNLQIGYLSQHFGTLFSIRFGALIVFISSLIIFITRGNFKKEN